MAGKWKTSCERLKVFGKIERACSRVSTGSWKSLQTCDVKENEEKLEGLLAYYRRQKATHKALVVEALLCVLRQLLAASSNEDERGRGFLHFDEAYGLYNSFFEKPVEKAEFRDHLLDRVYGLRVFVATVQRTR